MDARLIAAMVVAAALFPWAFLACWYICFKRRAWPQLEKAISYGRSKCCGEFAGAKPLGVDPEESFLGFAAYGDSAFHFFLSCFSRHFPFEACPTTQPGTSDTNMTHSLTPIKSI